MPSPLYTRLHTLAQAHAVPDSLDHILSLRSPDAIHAWGHAYLVAKTPALQKRMDNAAFKEHLISSGPFFSGSRTQVHEIIVDEERRRAVILMSYFLTIKGSGKDSGKEETVEHDLVWTLAFTDGEGEDVLIKESVEYVDGAAGARMSALVREVHGGQPDGVTGSIGITLKE